MALGEVKGRVKINNRKLIRSSISSAHKEKTTFKFPKISLSKNNIKSIITVFILATFTIVAFKVTPQIDLNLHYSVKADSTGERIDSIQNISFSQDNVAPNVLGVSKNEYFQLENILYIDQRAHKLDQYFLRNNSPLYGHGKDFTDACEHFGAPNDCIVVAAIAENETKLCTYPGSAEMFNCWGFGGGGIYRMSFGSFREAIFMVTDVLVNQYGIRYMENPRLMEDTFCGVEDPLCENWGNQVLDIMDRIRNSI